MNLSDHFTLEEATASDTALRLRIDNKPSDGQLNAMKRAAGGMEKVRELLGHPIRVNSWLRVPALNKAVGGASNSAHMEGYAIDFTCADFGKPIDIVKAIEASDIAFDEVIQEGTWVHISFHPALRRKIMTAHFGAAGTTYSNGV